MLVSAYVPRNECGPVTTIYTFHNLFILLEKQYEAETCAAIHKIRTKAHPRSASKSIFTLHDGFRSHGARASPKRRISQIENAFRRCCFCVVHKMNAGKKRRRLSVKTSFKFCVVLGWSCPVRVPFFSNTRTFESPSCGVCKLYTETHLTASNPPATGELYRRASNTLASRQPKKKGTNQTHHSKTTQYGGS